MSNFILVFLAIALASLLCLSVVLLLGIPLWIKPASRFYINPVPFFVHFRVTATRQRRIVFSMLLIWALIDACIGFSNGWVNGSQGLGSLGIVVVISAAMFFMSLCLNLLVMAWVAFVWDWTARRWKNRATHSTRTLQ